MKINFQIPVRIKDNVHFFRPAPEVERPKWLDDPRGGKGKVDVFPDDFPRVPFVGVKGMWQQQGKW